MLYEMLCGHVPFEGENVFVTMNQRVSQDPPSLLTRNPALSPELATVVMRAIRRDQKKRYQTMKELIHDLHHLKEVLAIPYEPETPKLKHLGRTILRIILLFLALCLVLFAFGLIVHFLHGTP